MSTGMLVIGVVVLTSLGVGLIIKLILLKHRTSLDTFSRRLKLQAKRRAEIDRLALQLIDRSHLTTDGSEVKIRVALRRLKAVTEAMEQHRSRRPSAFNTEKFSVWLDHTDELLTDQETANFRLQRALDW